MRTAVTIVESIDTLAEPSAVVFFKIIFTILAVIGAVVVFGILTIVVLYFLLVRRLANRVRSSLAELESSQGLTINAAGTRRIFEAIEELDYEWQSYGPDTEVPPMRIHLAPAPDSVWLSVETIDRIAAWFKKQHFELVGNYCISELGDECIRVLLSPDRRLVAAIRQDAFGNTPYVEICFDLGEGRRGGVSNPPGDTLQLPEGAVGEHFNFDLTNRNNGLAKMLSAAERLASDHGAREVPRDAIENFFEEAHAAEMDARIARGGLTKSEILAKFDDEPIEPEDIEQIQWKWQYAIQDFLLTQSVKAEQLERDMEVIAVYDASLRSFLIERMRQFYENYEDAQAEQVKGIIAELEAMFQKFSPREAMARFRPHLPESLRYVLLDQVRKPVEADLYLLPHSD